eukprot:3181325-Amphidinium_carterae.1
MSHKATAKAVDGGSCDSSSYAFAYRVYGGLWFWGAEGERACARLSTRSKCVESRKWSLGPRSNPSETRHEPILEKAEQSTASK